MVLDLLAVAKLKLFAAAGHGLCPLITALVWPFILKMSLHGRISKIFSEVTTSSRLFFFRLRMIVFQEQPQPDGDRWERALRLLRERAVNRRRGQTLPSDEEEASLIQVSMLSL